MTEITDQDRRLALRWCDMLGDSTHHEEAAATRRVILATVEAPAPALAEELRHIAEHWEEWATDTITSAIKAAADRAEQTEQERDEASSEVKRLTAERLDRNPETKARVEAALNNLDNAERVAVATVAPEENVAPYQQANAQGILAGSIPNPADVKPGEAWLIRVGEREAVATCDGTSDEWPWSVAFFDGESDDVADKAITLVSRLVPAPRVITNADELDALAEGSIVRDRAGHAWERYPDEDWYSTEELDDGFSPRRLAAYAGPVTVLWEPDA